MKENFKNVEYNNLAFKVHIYNHATTYTTVLHTTVGPTNVYKKSDRGTDYVVFVLI